jgi:hypothetical protein
MAVPHQVQRWKWMASLESAETGSRRPVAKPAAGCAVLAEWWYTLVNSLRSAGIPRAGANRARVCSVVVPPCTSTEYGTQCHS